MTEAVDTPMNTIRMAEMTWLGDPRSASAEKGAVYLERLAEFLVDDLRRRAAAQA